MVINRTNCKKNYKLNIIYRGELKLNRKIYIIISMNELNNAINGNIDLPSKPILITFDDGYYSNYEYIYPI